MLSLFVVWLVVVAVGISIGLLTTLGLGFNVNTWQYWAIVAPCAGGIGWFSLDIAMFITGTK